MGRFRTQTIGLDIDRGSLKAVQVSRGSGGYTLQHVGYHRLPPGTIADGEVADHDLLAAEIKEFWDSHSFKGKSVILGLSNQKVVVRLVDFPRMSPEDLKTAIGYEAQDHIPMPLEEAVMDYVVLGPAAEGSDLDRILIVAAQREMISRYTSAARAGGLRPVGVDVKALALTRSVLPQGGYDAEGAVLIMDIGSELTNLVVYQGGSPELTQFVPGGSLYFIQAIADAADIPDEEAEKHLMNPRVRLGYALDAEQTQEGPHSEPDTRETPLDARSTGEDTAELDARDTAFADEETAELRDPESERVTPPDAAEQSGEERSEAGWEPEAGATENGPEPDGAEETAAEEPETSVEGPEYQWDPALDYDVRRGLEDAVGLLAEDVQRSIDYHYSQPGARELSQVFVTGEGALVAGIDDYLSELLGIHTLRGNPLSKIVANRSNVSDEQVRVMEPVLAVALGLAMEES
ncbi:MAG TPA: type IV pilus assembly protein PilM [Rubrobacteraceae bacterium]|nr:type IV pilus assembly protein PilM [Rubrobacteraceae bacterium]